MPVANRNMAALRPRVDHLLVKTQIANGANSTASVTEENQMRFLLWAARFARKFQVAWAKAATTTRRNAVIDKVGSQRHEVAVDFSLWDFCPWVRTARSSVALGPIRVTGTLERFHSRCRTKQRTFSWFSPKENHTSRSL
jgi:hypothetical protein